MTIRGYSPLALLSALLVLAATGQSVAGVAMRDWWLLADAAVMAVCAVALAVLAVLDDAV